MKKSENHLISNLAKFSLGILLAFIVVAPSAAMAADHIIERAYFEDKGGRLVFEQARQQEFIPYSGVLNKGYTPSAFWVRLRIQPDTYPDSGTVPGDNKLILRIRPTYLDEIQLFDPLQPSAQPRITGDRYSWSQSEYPSLNFNFVIPNGHGKCIALNNETSDTRFPLSSSRPQAGERARVSLREFHVKSETQRDVFLRLKTTSANLLYVEALSPEEISKKDNQQNLLYSLYFALQALFFFWAMAHWITLRERLLGVFAFKQFMALLYSLSYIGYFRTLLSDVFPAPVFDNLTSLLIISYTASGVWLDFNLLREFNPPRWGMRLLLLFVALLPVEILLMLCNATMLTLYINAVVIMAELPLALLLAIKAQAWNKGVKNETPLVSRQILIGLYSLIMLSFFPFPLMMLGFIKGVGFATDYPLIHALLTGAFIILVLQLRVHRMEKLRIQAITRLAVAEMQVVQEQQKQLEKSKFLSMLTHELKTPLSVMRMMLGSRPPSVQHMEHAERAVRDMNNVIERCLQAGKLDDRQFEMIKSNTSLDEVLSELQLDSPCPERLNVAVAEDAVLLTDRQILHIILSNLIDNAIKYSQPESMIDILVEHEAKGPRAGLAVSVENLPGTAGWPDQEKVFKKYYRNKRAHHMTGSGLGLYLVANLTSLLEGEINYVPDNMKIRFSLWLPN